MDRHREDRGLTLALAGFFLLIASFAVAADVRNSKSGQDGAGVRFEYDLQGKEKEVEVILSINVDGTTRTSKDLHLEGDVGKVSPGKGKRILWNVLQDFPRGLSTEFTWELTAGGGLKVAVMDVNKILNESEAGQAAKKKMETRYQELKKTIDGKQNEARKLKEEIDKQKVMMGKEKLKEKEDALLAKVNELRKLTQEGEREMQTRQGELTREVLKQVEVEVERVSEEEQIDLVLVKEVPLDKEGGIIRYSHKLKDLILVATGTDIASLQDKDRGEMIRKYMATNALDITAKVMKMVDKETSRRK